MFGAFHTHTGRECSHINAWQPRYARTKTDLIHESRAGPGSWHILVPSFVRIAKTTGLSAAFVCCSFAIVSKVPCWFYFLFYFIYSSVFGALYTQYTTTWQARHARTKTDSIHKSSAGLRSSQNLVPRFARIATKTELSAAFVCYLFAFILSTFAFL